MNLSLYTDNDLSYFFLSFSNLWFNRYNLDPWGRLKDTELWSALEKAKLKAKVQSLEGGLDAKMSQNGDNLSLGERQLVCLARAICLKSNVSFLFLYYL